ncbi:MAG: arginine--tRNA ligase [Candidatus Pacearchaeota archaeon]|jgi:arginyl-tRNA synthetase
MKSEVVKILQNAFKELDLKLKDSEIEEIIEIPKNYELGDYAFPCFFLAKILKTAPHEIAVNVRQKIEFDKNIFEDIQAVGPYINFFVNKLNFSFNFLQGILQKKEKFGKILNTEKDKKTIMVEFPSPNTNKPLHLGHLRNMAIGESVSRILEFSGYKVIRANLNNDRGIHICKSMAAYSKFGKNKVPGKIKGDHFVGEFYVKFNEKSKTDNDLEILSHRLLQKYEEGDKKTLALWKKMNNWALKGFEKTYSKFGIKHQVEDYESKIYKKGKEIVFDGLNKGIFKKDKSGAIIYDLRKKNLGEKVLLRADGTSIYITQDLYLAKSRFEKYKLDELIYVVGNEQDYHFNVLFELLEKLGITSKDKLNHLSYGMVFLPEGKMKSREGTVVDADDLIEKVQNLVKKELIERAKLSNVQLEKRSLIISLAAIKYILLKTDIRKNMVFDPKNSINFEGDTGPYIQYSYARASSILKKAKIEQNAKKEIDKIEPNEFLVIKKMSEFPLIISKSANDLNPSLISNYVYELSQLFNEFYHACPVIGSDKEFFRLNIVKTFRDVIKSGLYLIGIDVLEEM